MSAFIDNLTHAWNAFRGRDKKYNFQTDADYYGYGYRPDRVRLTTGTEKTIVNSVLNRIAADAAAITINHVRVNEEGVYQKTIDSSLNECLTVEANIDQTGRAFIMDAVLSMLDEGCIAIVPTAADIDLTGTNSFNIESMRIGQIVTWFPDKVRVKVYNEFTMTKEEIILPKSKVAIVENPFYSVMNEPNSTLKRLVRKLSLLDVVDEQTSSGKLDVIVQLPHTLKTEARRKQAELRRKTIEDQLRGSKYGIAYIDATEHITQLNRPAENNLMSQVEYLTSMLYSQLGITDAILNGTAGEMEMQNYYTRTIEPILSAITDEMKRKFLTKTARSQGQSIMFFRDPFKLIPVTQVAGIADAFTRNEIMSSNEFRAIVGRKPDSNPKSDELINSNMPHDPSEFGQNESENSEAPQYTDPNGNPLDLSELEELGIDVTKIFDENGNMLEVDEILDEDGNIKEEFLLNTS